MKHRSTPRPTLTITQNALAYMAIIGFFVMTGYIVSHGVGNLDAEDSFIVGNLTGMSAAIARDIYGYYFGNGKEERNEKLLHARNSKGKKNQITKTINNANDTIS